MRIRVLDFVAAVLAALAGVVLLGRTFAASMYGVPPVKDFLMFGDPITRAEWVGEAQLLCGLLYLFAAALASAARQRRLERVLAVSIVVVAAAGTAVLTLAPAAVPATLAAHGAAAASALIIALQPRSLPGIPPDRQP